MELRAGLTRRNARQDGEALGHQLVGRFRARELQAASLNWPSWDLTYRQLCDLELLLSGAFSPLEGFLARDDYEAVLSGGRLRDGVLWPIPVTLDVTESLARRLGAQTTLALRDSAGVMLAALHVSDVWCPDRQMEAEAVYGTTDRAHPGVEYLLDVSSPWYVGGHLEGVHLPFHYDFAAVRHTPAQLVAEFVRRKWTRVIAFQTRNPMHRAHYEITRRAMEDVDGALLIHPVVGPTKPGDLPHHVRVRCYRALLPHYPQGQAMLSLLQLAMRFAGPREALWHALIRKNYGCSHMIVGRDHAGPGLDGSGRPFYEPFAAQELVRQHETEIGVGVVAFDEMVYSMATGRYVPAGEVLENSGAQCLSGTDLRRRLAAGEEIPAWFTFPEVARELKRAHPPRHKQGFTVFFTGLSGAGKSTIAGVLLAKFLETSDRPTTLLDGDVVRKHLSSELGFSKEHRDINIRRIGFVASEITKNGGIAICAPIAPYDEVRKEVRRMIEPHGGFVLVHVATPLAVCEQRDRKGLYAKARAGLIPQFTGISDPYERPEDAEVLIDTTDLSAEDAAEAVISLLVSKGYIVRELGSVPEES